MANNNNNKSYKGKDYHNKGSKGKSNYKDKTAYGNNQRSKTDTYRTHSGAASKYDAMPYDEIRSNDISWWNKSPLFNDATRVPFNRIYGSPVNTQVWQGSTSYSDWNFEVPGIMVLDFQPTIGYAEDSNSPVNRAFTSLYGEIYSKTTGAMQFQQQDLAHFVLSMSSITTAIAHVKRALGVSQLYSGVNYYYPISLIKAMGINPTTIIGKQDLIRQRLNNAILSFNNLKVPDFMSIFKRQYGLAHNIYCDEDDQATQLYLFRPTGLYIYDGTDELEPLQYNMWLNANADVNAILDLIDAALSAWRNSSDLGLISGSIQRAYKDSNIVSIDYVTTTDTVIPTIDRNIMWQIENAVAVDPQDIIYNVILQDAESAFLYYKPAIKRHGAGDNSILGMRDKLLRTYDGVSDSEFIMEATRLMPVLTDTWYSGAAEQAYGFRANTEIITGIKIWWLSKSADGLITTEDFSMAGALDLTLADMDQDNINVIMTALDKYTKFKHAPILWLATRYEGAEPGTQVYKYAPLCDIYKYTTIDNASLVGLQEAALQSVYDANLASNQVTIR